MKDKKDGKNRAYGVTTHCNQSPHASTTTDKDDLTHRTFYQPTVLSSTFSAPIFSVPDRYELSPNYGMKQSTYHHHPPPPPPPPTLSFENYYYNTPHSTLLQQQSGLFL